MPKSLTVTLLVFIACCLCVTAAIDPIIIPFGELDIAVWRRRNNADGTGDGGELCVLDPTKADAPNGPSMTLVDPADPSTWTVTQSWQHDWQGQNGAFSTLTASTYTNLPWVIFDLGREAIPDRMWMWNVSEATGWNRGIRDFYLFYSSEPTVPVTWWAKSAALPAAATEYDFFSGGWTQFGGIHTMDRGANGSGYDFLLDFAGGIPSCRYFGIAATTNWGGSGSWERAGICTAAFTRFPPPSGTVIMIK